jgi:hypothetical protein
VFLTCGYIFVCYGELGLVLRGGAWGLEQSIWVFEGAWN